MRTQVWIETIDNGWVLHWAKTFRNPYTNAVEDRSEGSEYFEDKNDMLDRLRQIFEA